MDSIISRDTIRARARAAFERGEARDSHDMNPEAVALAVWLEEYDLRTAEQSQDRRWNATELAEVSPP